jgi:23S rRNA pseudouridine2605 synthase
MTDPTSTGEPGVRLQKVLARAGVSSRRGGEELIVAGRVRVNDRVVTELGTRIDPGVDRVTVDGKAIQLETPVYILLHKPDEVVCSAEPKVDDRGRATVVSLIQGVSQRIYPVGRLDYHTRGALLLTNDGDLAAKLTHPRHKVPKTYHAKFQGKLADADIEQLLGGVTLEDGTLTQPLVELIVVRETEANTWVQLTLTQGLYRQVRRMGDAIGHPVLKLIRVAFADITPDDLEEGRWRHLREDEILALREAVTPAPAVAKTKRRRRGGRRGGRPGSGEPPV